jgi:hypothetical protein
MADTTTLSCVNPVCAETVTRPEEGSALSTEDLAKLAGWVALDLRYGGQRWVCPTHQPPGH